jgi:soluble lytic murein transglycosylase
LIHQQEAGKRSFLTSAARWPLVAFLFIVLLAASSRAPHAENGADGTELSARDQSLYEQAFAALAKDRWQEARRLAKRAKNQLPAKVILWLDLTRPGPGRSFDEITDFLNANPQWPLRQTLIAQGERAMPEDLPVAAVLAWFGERPPETGKGAIRLGAAFLASGKPEQARAVAASAWVAQDFGRSDEKLFLEKFGELLTERDHAQRLDRLLWDDEREQAQRMLNRVAPGVRLLAQARLRLKSTGVNAVAIHDSVPATYRDDPGLTYDVVRQLRRQGRIDKALQYIDPPPKNVLRPDLMWEELQIAARGSLAKGNVSAAYRLASAHGSDEGESFVEGEWLAGWIALRFLKDPEIAARHFTSLYAGAQTIVSRTRAAYWLGQAMDAQGNRSEAENWYRNAARNLSIYYGQLAALRLRVPPLLHVKDGMKPGAAEEKSFAAKEFVKVVRLLAQLRQKARIRPFITALTTEAKTDIDFQLVANLARAAKRDDLAVAAAKAARQKGYELVDYLFPTMKLPKGDEPEAALVLAVIRQESAFDPQALSPSGAMGLMQLLPSTAKQVAKKLGIKKFKDKMLVNDPTFNIRVGRLYLRQLIDRFSGSYALAIAAYNAGPGRVRGWLEEFGDPRDLDVDMIDWIETIPFSETRNYVQRVMENVQVYRSRLAAEAVPIRLAEDLERKSEN